MVVISPIEAASAACRYAAEELASTGNAAAVLRAWRSQLSWPDPAIAQTSFNNCNCSAQSACTEVSMARPLSAHNDSDAFLLWLELEEDCNLDCVFCYNPWRPAHSGRVQETQLAYDRLIAAVDVILESVPIGHITLSGGEPLLYPNLDRLLGDLRGRCSSIGLTSNGRSLTASRARRLHDGGVQSVSIPIHSSKERVHDQLSGGRSWPAAVRAVANALAAQMVTTVSAVVTRLNADSVVGAARIGTALGVQSFVLNSFHPTGQGANRDDLELPEETFQEIYRKFQREVGPGGDVRVGSPPTTSREARSINRVVLSPHGEVKLCNQSRLGLTNVGGGNFAALREVLRDLSEKNIAKLAPQMDSCSCFSPQNLA